MQVLASLGEYGIRRPQGDVTEERKHDSAVATPRIDQHLREALERRQRNPAQPYECHEPLFSGWFSSLHRSIAEYNDPMTKEQVKEILDRVLTWPQEDQEKVARFAWQLEQWRGDGISDEEWKIIEERAARRDLASDEDVERVFSRYRSA
jgi:hypothetical protein